MSLTANKSCLLIKQLELNFNSEHHVNTRY